MKRQQGSILIVLLMCLALAISLPIVMLSGGGDKIAHERVQTEQIRQTFHLITGQLQKCQSLQTTGTDNGYPVAGSWVLVNTLTCPANGWGLWNMRDGIQYSPAQFTIPGFGVWYYRNTGGVVELLIEFSPCTRFADSGAMGTLWTGISKATPLSFTSSVASAPNCASNPGLTYKVVG